MHANLLTAVAAGLLSAVLHLSAQWGPFAALMLALFAPLPLLMAGLGLGFGAVLTAAGAAVAALVLAADPARALVFAAGDAVPAALIVRLALLNRPAAGGGVEWYPPGRILAFLTLYCAAAFLAVALYLSSGPDGVQTAVSRYVDSFRGMLVGPQGGTPGVERMLAALKQVFPFMVVTWWVVIVCANAAIAQRLLVRFGRNRRPAPDLRRTELPQFMAPALVAAAAAALLGSGRFGFVASNLALMLCIPYFLTGLAVMHAVAARWNGRRAILFAVYLFLLLFGWPVLLVAGLGLVEQWMGLRDRWAAPGPGNERNE